ncbi:MAG: TOBE domain-containing protein, partial [Acetobacteraceae bacterium]
AVHVLPPGPLIGSGRENRVAGEVVARHTLSDRSVCVVRCGAAEVVVSMPAAAGARPGDAVILDFPAEAIRLWGPG